VGRRQGLTSAGKSPVWARSQCESMAAVEQAECGCFSHPENLQSVAVSVCRGGACQRMMGKASQRREWISNPVCNKIPEGIC
jgi:hypothetical protein